MQHVVSTRRLTTRWQRFVLRVLLSVLGVALCLLGVRPDRVRADAPSDACAPVTYAFGADLLPGVGTSSIRAGREGVRAFSFGLFGAYAGGVTGFSLAGFVDLQRGSLCGVQLSGVANVVGGESRGLQLSMVNYAGKGSRGAALGLLNYVGGEQRGAAISLANITLGGASGLSAGLLNFAHGSVGGASLGLVNVATSDMHGAQLGLVNVAGGDASGLQAGLVNVAGDEMRGLQLGLVNYASRGQTAIGLFRIVRKGRTDLDLWGAGENGLLMAGVRHGGKRVHNLYYVGTRVGEHGARVAGTLGIGVRVLEQGRDRLDIDALSTVIYRMHSDVTSHQQGVRVPLTVMMSRWIGLMVAPSYQFYFNPDPGERSEASIGVTKIKTTGKTRIESFPGISLGLRFELPSRLPRANWAL
jgi:hypothetical protein